MQKKTVLELKNWNCNGSCVKDHIVERNERGGKSGSAGSLREKK